MYAQLSCASLYYLHEKECKHIICSEFSQRVACTKPGNEGVKGNIMIANSRVVIL